jgi:hypothetical protein
MTCSQRRTAPADSARISSTTSGSPSCDPGKNQGGALYGLIPAICRVYFSASEILISLMLVYVANLGMDYVVRGPWRDPPGPELPDYGGVRSGGERANVARGDRAPACRLDHRAHRRDADSGPPWTHHRPAVKDCKTSF